MIFAKSRNAATAAWAEQDLRAKIVIGLSLLFLLFAYLPTLQNNYVTQDQWRAFRYSTNAQPAHRQVSQCYKTTEHFYLLTGRPLVWMTECVEHTVVTKISDFVYLRPFCLAIVLITALYLGAVLAPILGSLPLGVVAASAFVMTPGYSFMYLQGGPAVMVLLSIILAAASFRSLREFMVQPFITPRTTIKGLRRPLILFMAACLIYPGWAFLVVALALAAFGFDRENPLRARLKSLGLTLLFYIFGSLFYYVFVKVSVAISLHFGGEAIDLGTYQVSMQTSPSELWERVLLVSKRFYDLPPFNLASPAGLTVAILVLFSVYAGWNGSKDQRNLRGIFSAALVFLIGSILLIGSVSPWVFSHQELGNFFTRVMIPWYLFFAIATAGLGAALARAIRPQFLKSIPTIALAALLFPVAAQQNRLSSWEVLTSGVEIQALRSQLYEWLDKKGYVNQRYLVFVRPTRERLAYVEQALNGQTYVGENTVLSSAENPVSIPWMINGILRERPVSEIGKTIQVIDCEEDQTCAYNVVQHSQNIALLRTDGDVPILSPYLPFILNLSLITSKPAYPTVSAEAPPDITASSQLGNLGAYGLMSQMRPGWHSERTPTYPQAITIDFHHQRAMETLSLQAQSGYPLRAPKTVKIMTSDDSNSWDTVLSADNGCVGDTSDNWRTMKLPHKVTARFLRLEILANCGDPDFLTLRGLNVN